MKETREAIDRITSRLDHLEQRTEELIRSQKRFHRLLITFISFFFGIIAIIALFILIGILNFINA